jgi:SEC-C motif-containing protein
MRAPQPEALMRSRYAAFSLGLGAYLVDTLAATHPERFRPRDVLVRELSAVHLAQRFTGLRILASATGGPGGDQPRRGEVLFHARIFAKRRGTSIDQSFVELSDFVREDGGWRYVDGVLLQAKLFEDAQLASLTRETFLARVARNSRSEA